MTRRTTRSTVTGSDGRALTRAERAQQRHLDGQLEGEAQKLHDGTKAFAGDVQEGALTKVLRLLSGRW